MRRRLGPEGSNPHSPPGHLYAFDGTAYADTDEWLHAFEAWEVERQSWAAAHGLEEAHVFGVAVFTVDDCPWDGTGY